MGERDEFTVTIPRADAWIIQEALTEWAEDQEEAADDYEGAESDELRRRADVARTVAAATRKAEMARD